MKRVYSALILCCFVAGTAQAAEGGFFMDKLRDFLGIHAATARSSTDGSTRTPDPATRAGLTVLSTGPTGGNVPPCGCAVGPNSWQPGDPCYTPPPRPDRSVPEQY